MKVVLVDNSVEGHRITYLKAIAKCLILGGHNVSMVCPNSEEMTNELSEIVTFYNYEEPKQKTYSVKRFDWTLNILRRWISLSNLIELKIPDVDLVFFTFIDHFRFSLEPMIHSRLTPIRKRIDKALPFFLDKVFPYKWVGLSLQPQYTIDAIFLSRHNKKVLVLNEFFKFSDIRVENKKVVFPDITDTTFLPDRSDLARDIIKKANGRKIVSLVGALAKRKSLMELLEVAESLKDEPFYFLIAGEKHFYTFEPHEIARLEKLEKEGRENCFFYFNRVPDGIAFNELILISDIIFASYLQFKDSSNLLTKAAFFRKQIIVSEYAVMSKRVQKYNLGCCIAEGNVAEICSALRLLCSNFNFAGAQFEEYYETHSLKQLDKILIDCLEF